MPLIIEKYAAGLLIYEILETTFLITLNITNANPKLNFGLTYLSNLNIESSTKES